MTALKHIRPPSYCAVHDATGKPSDRTYACTYAAALHAAALTGNISAVEALVKKGALVDISDGSDDTPLSLACRRELLDTATVPPHLSPLPLESDLRCTADRGRTQKEPSFPASHSHTSPVRPRAARYDARDVMELLLRSGGKLDTVNKDGLTPLGEALVNNCMDTAEALLAAGAALTPARGCVICELWVLAHIAAS